MATASAGVKIFSGRSTVELANKIAEKFGTKLGDVKVSVFSDGEFQPSFEETVRGQDVFIIQSTTPPSDNLFELLLIKIMYLRLCTCNLKRTRCFFLKNHQEFLNYEQFNFRHCQISKQKVLFSDTCLVRVFMKFFKSTTLLFTWAFKKFGCCTFRPANAWSK